MSTALRLFGRLDILSNMPSLHARRAPCSHARLRALVTKPYEISGLELVPVRSIVKCMSLEGAFMKLKWITGVVVGLMILLGGAATFSQSAAVGQGKEVYAVQKCSLCHSIAGSGGGVALDGVGARIKPDDIKKRIRAPKEVKADSEMKAYPNLPEKDINSLIAYLQTLK